MVFLVVFYLSELIMIINHLKKQEKKNIKIEDDIKYIENIEITEEIKNKKSCLY